MATLEASEHDRISVASSEFKLDDGNKISANMVDQEHERMTLARKENATVNWMRAAVFLVLLVTTIVVTTKVYTFTRDDQVQDFEKDFLSDATKVVDSFHKAMERTLEAVDALSVTITSHAKATGATFPYVTLPDFSIRCANSRVLSGSVAVHYHPVVTDQTRLGWEAFQIANRNHFDDEYEAESQLRESQDMYFGHSGALFPQDESVLRDTIEDLLLNGSYIESPLNTGPFLPIWQVSPVIPHKKILNFNVLSHPAAAGAYREAITTGQAVIDIAANLKGENLGDSGQVFQLILSMSQFRYNVQGYLGDPSSGMGYPVFDSFNLKTRKVVGMIATTFYWRLLFEDILPPNTRGIICVIENTLNQTFTYRIDENVTYMGIGDHHESKYDHLVVSADIASYIAKTASPATKALTSVDLNTNYCRYKLRVYPSQDNEDIYVNRDPFVQTMVIVSVFAFTSIVFVLYTFAVARRQEVVMNRAVASSAIVSSLFPSQVRDKIYQENEVEKKKTWVVRDGFDAEGNDNFIRPIAELFEHTTIMFADMVGFTLWSSKRQPVEVFELLETLYKAFDVIAVRRNVFKVETIGDCYVAVAGLPDPQEDHALIMAKFADECMSKMKELTTELSMALGSDTASLAMRVGLHSGSVTGGVLRGQKSRFQLFGDTMNTAARMETNGEPGRIHVSKETADEIIAKGKSSWVKPRDDKIVAKGKGELQTYWVTPRAAARSEESSNSKATSRVERKHEAESFEI